VSWRPDAHWTWFVAGMIADPVLFVVTAFVHAYWQEVWWVRYERWRYRRLRKRYPDWD
jgi:hypothetical protein